MKIRKIISAFLAVLMTMTAMSVAAFAQEDEAELADAIAPVELKITSAANDQGCLPDSIKYDAVDSFGRTVTQIFPGGTNNVSPATFIKSNGPYAAARKSDYRVIKFVYYTSTQANPAPTISVWADAGTNAMERQGSASLVTNGTYTAPGGGWNVAYYDLNTSTIDFANGKFMYAYMFNLFQQKGNLHADDTVYFGYVGMFDTVENAQAHKSDFEGDIALTAINVDGTAISGFDAATTTYTVDLAGKDYVPEVTVTGTGNANNLKIEASAYDKSTGTATATVTADETVYTLNFTGGAMLTDKTPIVFDLSTTYGGDAQGSTGEMVADEFGRTINNRIPRTAVTARGVCPGGHFSTSTSGYTVLKFVYRTSESHIPTLSANAVKSDNSWIACGNGSAQYETTPEAGKWNVVYFPIKEVADTTNNNALVSIKYWQITMGAKKASETTSDDYYQIGFVGLFGSMLDAKEHKTVFEGDLNVTSVKMGDTEIATAAGTYSYDAAGAASVPELTITATGNTNGVVITNGEFDISGNAASTVKNGDETIITVNITGGEPKEIEPLTMQFEWIGGKEQGVSGVEEITDEFTRSYKRFAPALTYYEGGSDLVPTIAVSPGGSVTNHLPEGMAATDYKIAKIVVRSNEDYAPRLIHYGGKSGYVDAVNAADFVKDEWCVLYYEVTGLTMYQLAFTPDASPNHPAGEYDISYAALFGNLSAAQAHQSAFEGEFTITDVRLDGTSVGNVTHKDVDLAGAGSVPVLTVVATGDAEGVAVTNGLIDAEGKATSTVTKDGTALVTVNFTGASTAFKIVDILVDGKSVENFDTATTEYTFNLGFAATKPVITYTYQGIEETVTIDIVDTTVDNVTSKYVATLKTGDTTLYTLTFNVDTNKPEMLLNTLYKLNTEKKLTVAYLGGSVTSGTGSSSSNTKSWRAITRDWLKSTFPNAAVTEVNAAIGGTGAIFGVFRNQQQILDTAAGTPDLLFVETVINDSYDSTYNDNSYIRYTESIIKQTLEQNPKCDIILVVTGDSSTFKNDAASETPVYGLGYDYLAERYNIPVIHVGFELAHQIKADYGANFSTSSEGWKHYFLRTYANNAVDGVHPNDNGYAHYAKTIIDQCLTPNLPTTYAPLAKEYVNKTNPEGSYSEENNLGSIMLDADMFSPADLVGNSYLGGFTASKGSGLYDNVFKSYSEGDVVSFTFNSSNLGIWTWSYGNANGKNGTDIIYSIDGGEPQTANLYRSYPNHKVYFLAKDLDNTETHTIRIYHNDSANPVDIRWFLMWGMPEGQTAQLATVPYFDFATETYSLTVGGEAFANFDPEVTTYEIPVELTAGEEYPTVAFTPRADYYGYAVEQASGENNVAKLIIDNVGVYTFEFVNGNAVEIKSTTDSKLGEKTGAVEFAEAAAYKLQFKKEADDWTSAAEYDAGTATITGLEPGAYNVRYVIEEGVYGITKSFNIWTIFPYENIYYVTDGGTGDGTSAENAAPSSTALYTTVANAVKYFGDKAKTETCYIVLVGDVIHNNRDSGIDTTAYKDIVITSEQGALLHVRSHVYFKKTTASSGKTTFKNVNIKLGNPDAAQGSMNSEIMVSAYANAIEFKDCAITEYAVNAYNEKRTSNIYVNYYHDGATGGATGIGNAITIDSPDLKISGYRLTGYNAGDENGDTLLYFNNGYAGEIKLGGHSQAETHTGVTKGYMNGGETPTVLVSGNAALIHKGTVAFIYNAGKADAIKVTSPGNAEGDVDRIAILNNGMTSTITKTNLDYILHGAAGGTADITTADNRLTGFTFTTDKETVVINKGLETEKTLTVTNGTASIAVSELAAGEYTVTYEDVPLPEGVVEVKTSIKLGREEGTKPASGNHLVVKIKDKATGNVLKTIDLEDAESLTDANGCLAIDMQIDVSNVSGAELEIVAVKSGYAPYTLTTTAENLETDIGTFFTGMESGFEAGHGDIKGDYDDEYGDGVIDIDDFIRVLRGFSIETPEYKAAVDLNEDNSITVADISIIKRNFGFRKN